MSIGDIEALSDAMLTEQMKRILEAAGLGREFQRDFMVSHAEQVALSLQAAWAVERAALRARTSELEAQLITVLQREAATHIRLEAKIERIEQERDAVLVRAEQAESRVAVLEAMVAAKP